MIRLQHSVAVDAPAPVLWSTLLGPSSYGVWTAPFTEGGAVLEGNWDEHSTVRFTWQAEKGLTGGMVAEVEEHRPAQFLSLRYTGQVVDGVEDTTSEDALRIVGTREDYTVTEREGGCMLAVGVDADEAYAQWMDEQWQKALRILKDLSEAAA